MYFLFFFFKQKTAYEMRISDWSSDVCSSDLVEFGLLFSSRASSGSSRSGSNSSGSRNAPLFFEQLRQVSRFEDGQRRQFFNDLCKISHVHSPSEPGYPGSKFQGLVRNHAASLAAYAPKTRANWPAGAAAICATLVAGARSEEHTSELQ